ncbi:response regulator [Tardiphaga robiniae]|uniref:DNA-binding response regulator n=1 Tax=Tardiphaga robiniae TaxID=943830 RepID=A0A163XPF8_9BRAD|nr:response regulator transcription factor [Tardiphaga robiniae]KZD21173.1 DNA-binding response regulator [Tardiphaga robiniae]
MPLITVALVDDHPLMLEGLVQLLSRSGDFKVVATGKSAQDILDICESHEPEVIVVDLLMDDDVCKVITTAIRISPNTRVVTFTGAEGVEPAILALDAGATGYVMKGSTSAELVQAIKSAKVGETYITRLFANDVIAKLRDAPLRRKAAKALILNVRERQIMRLLMVGKNDAEIAIALRISETTLEKHMIDLWHKLKVRNRREAVIAAKRYERPPVMH